MKLEEILAMEAGIELDALVAEKVMGECKHDYKVVGPNVWNHQCQNCGIMDSNFSQSTLYLVGTDKEYSTDISEAWEVVEKLMKDHRYRVDIISDVNYSVQIMTYEGCKADFHAPTAPEAICKAALLTVLEGKIYET